MRDGDLRPHKPLQSRVLKICTTLQQGKKLQFEWGLFDRSEWDETASLGEIWRASSAEEPESRDE